MIRFKITYTLVSSQSVYTTIVEAYDEQQAERRLLSALAQHGLSAVRLEVERIEK